MEGAYRQAASRTRGPWRKRFGWRPQIQKTFEEGKPQMKEPEMKKPKEQKERKQQGQLYIEGGNWYLRYYDDRVINGAVTRKRLRRLLGPTEISERDVREQAEDFLRPLNRCDLDPEDAYSL